MKQIPLYLVCLAVLLVMTACGGDDPVLPRDRDVTMTVDALTHVLDNATGEATLTLDDKNTVVVHQKSHTADFTLHATYGGASHSFAVTGVELKAVDYQDYRYTFAAAGGGVTNLTGTVDLSDQVLILSYDVDGRHVCVSIPDVFFAQTGVKFTYADASSTTTATSFWTLKMGPKAQTAGVSIGDLLIGGDLLKTADGNWERKGRQLTTLVAHGATVTPTSAGFKVTASAPDCFAVPAGTTSPINDYQMRDIELNVDMTQGHLDGTLNMHHILERDDKGNPTLWDDYQVEVSGETFKRPMF